VEMFIVATTYVKMHPMTLTH